MQEITMPKLSDSMEMGKIVQWRVKEGDKVREGDVLAEVESDKAVMELECFHDGSVAKIVHGDDTEVPVGEVIALIAAEGEEAATAPAAAKAAAPEKLKAEARPKPGKAAPAAAVKAPPPRPAPVSRPEGERVAISPYARKLAEERGIDYTQLTGSGPAGRIIADDIEKASAAPVAAKPAPTARPPAGEPSPKKTTPEVEPLARALLERYALDSAAIVGTGAGGRITADDVIKALTGKPPKAIKPSPDEELPELDISDEEAEVQEASFRLKTLARRVTASKHVIPHFYVTSSVNVTQLLAKKDALKQKYGATVTHLIMLACLKALKAHPEVNRTYDRGRIIIWKGVHLGLAVDTDEGLSVAVLRDAQDLSLEQLVERTGALVERARSGKLTADERRHPTFTITNLGMFDVEEFQPIINPPSSMTLAVSSALPAPVVRDDAIYVARVMKLTASCDHRIIDGVTAARYLKDLKALLEVPDALLD